MANNKDLKEEAALIEYLDECGEMLERFSKSLSQLESGAIKQESIAGIYRDIHTIKGSSQFFGFAQVGVLAHAMESSLDPVRSGLAKVSPLLIDALYQGADIIATLLTGIRKDHKEPDLHKLVSSIVPKLIDLASNYRSGEKSKSEALGQASSVEARSNAVLADEKSKLAPSLEEKSLVNPESSQNTQSSDVSKSQASEEIPGFVLFDDLPPSLQVAVAKKADSTANPENPTPSLRDETTHLEEVGTKTGDPGKNVGEESHNETIRVHVALLDNLMNLVGELVLIRNQLLQHAKVNDSDGEFAKMSQRLNILTAELQNEVMKTRMQPVGNVLNKFTRVVREMGRDLGKKIELTISGAETELDKTIIEAVKDPLTHIIRNSVDHGIESSADRKSASKPEVGRLNIKAHHESGQVIIEIADDGRGLDQKKIALNAVNKGLITSEALAKMSEREVQFLIFSPGFSTAQAVSSLSGRGVGMDVVKTNIERIGGMVDLMSSPGRGTTVKLKIPLTLAIVPALIVKALNQRFAIPQSKLVELVRVDASDTKSEKIENLQGSPVLRLRGKILPLLNLSSVLTKPDAKKSMVHSSFGDSVNIVILNADTFQFGLVVDEVEDTADIVVKSLSSFLKEISHFSGATIMGDGSVALTLDVMGISTSARLASEIDSTSSINLDGFSESRSRHQMDASEFLMIDVGAPGSYVIPLTVVSRLEEFEPEDFELSGEQKVVRYRDSLLPIFSLPEFLHLPFANTAEKREKTPVVVIRRGDNLFGIEVIQIQDVASLPSRIDQTVRDRPGILGTMVADENVLVVVDIFGMLDLIKTKLAVDAGLVSSESETLIGKSRSDLRSKRRKRRILVVEDSSFFRNYMKQILEEAGYQVEIACDGLEGWNTLESYDSNHFSMVLSDIEMPEMNGLELAKKISSDAQYTELYLVAITTRFSGSDLELGREAGFTRYLEKLNADTLIAEIDELLSSAGDKSQSRKELKLASGN